MEKVEKGELETVLPREAALEVCPICGFKVIARNGHTVCTSLLCKNRPIDDCCAWILVGLLLNLIL